MYSAFTSSRRRGNEEMGERREVAHRFFCFDLEGTETFYTGQSTDKEEEEENPKIVFL